MRQRGDAWGDDAYGDDCTGTGTSVVGPPQWTEAIAGNPKPVCYVKGDIPKLKVKVQFSNPEEEYGPALPFEFAGHSSDFDFSGQGTASASGDVMQADVWLTTTGSFPQHVSNDNWPIDWKVRTVGDWYDLENNTSNALWVTWAEPYSGNPGITAMRVFWVTDKANGRSTIGDIADAIWGALGNHNPPYETDHEGYSTQVNDWRLLMQDDPNQNPPYVSPYYGYCDQQANLMKLALWMLGVSSEVRSVRASDGNEDGRVLRSQTPYDCEDYEISYCVPDQRWEWLELDFYGSGTPESMNDLEGCCVVGGAGGTWYAVWPKEKASGSAYYMLRELAGNAVTQRYAWWDAPHNTWVLCNQADASPPVAPLP